MARFNYNKLQSSSQKLVERFGQLAILRLAGTSGTGDAWNPVPESEAKPYPVTVVMSNFSDIDRDGTLIQGNDRLALIAPKDVPTDFSDDYELELGAEPGRPYQIISVQTVNPGGTALMYRAQLRR